MNTSGFAKIFYKNPSEKKSYGPLRILKKRPLIKFSTFFSFFSYRYMLFQSFSVEPYIQYIV